jgi:hypothetical protein
MGKYLNSKYYERGANKVKIKYKKQKKGDRNPDISFFTSDPYWLIPFNEFQEAVTKTFLLLNF